MASPSVPESPPVLRPRGKKAPWYATAFDRFWLRAYAHRNDEEANRHVPYVVRHLGLKTGDRVLDVGCGAGRYCRALERLGMRTTGVDLSEELLEEARERSPGLPGTPSYVRWDARDLPFREQFEGAISMFTSIGYFDDAEDDRSILRGVRRALVPGGRFLLDFLNAENTRATLEARTERISEGPRVVEERRIDEAAPGGPAVRKRVIVYHPTTGHAEAEFEERVRLYTADEIDALLDAARLVPVGERMGDVEGNPWTESSPRLVRIAERARTGGPGDR
jgi:SAM-dependent methyltransferase